MPSANSTENDIVFGGIKTLDQLIKSTLKVFNGDLYVVLTGCVGGLIGDDVPSLVNVLLLDFINVYRICSLNCIMILLI